MTTAAVFGIIFFITIPKDKINRMILKDMVIIMKKITVVLLLASLLLSLCSCSDKSLVAEYTDEYDLPTYMTRLYPQDGTDTKFAVLLRAYDKAAAKLAVTDTLTGDFNVVYTLDEGTTTYELYAGEGIIAFYQLIAYTDSSINYALKVVDTTTEPATVYSPYSKTVSSSGDTQTRFLCVWNGCVYYLTASPLLNACRIMKFELKTQALSEFQEFPLTVNTLTGGHSCTFININNGYLICGFTDGYAQSLRVYNLRSGSLVKEKSLPDTVGVVYNADYDVSTGLYALYYCETNSSHEALEEKIAYTTDGADSLAVIFTANENVYISRETVKLLNNVIYYNIQDGTNENAYGAFTGALYNIVDGKTTLFSGSLQLFFEGSTLYSLNFDKKLGFDKMRLTKTDIK